MSGRLNWSARENWVDKVGGLPNLIERVAIHIMESGRPRHIAIPAAINWVKYICATGDVKNWAGRQNVNAPSRAAACKAVAEWNAKKARARAS
jgi:hypothetical protein